MSGIYAEVIFISYITDRSSYLSSCVLSIVISSFSPVWCPVSTLMSSSSHIYLDISAHHKLYIFKFLHVTSASVMWKNQVLWKHWRLCDSLGEVNIVCAYLFWIRNFIPFGYTVNCDKNWYYIFFRSGLVCSFSRKSFYMRTYLCCDFLTGTLLCKCLFAYQYSTRTLLFMNIYFGLKSCEYI